MGTRMLPIYAALSSAELFNLTTGVWETLPNMSLPRTNHAVAVCCRKIYVCGGRAAHEFDSNATVETFRSDGAYFVMECFDLGTNQWTEFPPMPSPHSYHTCSGSG